MQIVLVNVSPDSNRGACALTWASLDFVLSAFPRAAVAIVPIAVNPPEADPFRHTMPRYPNVAILPPLVHRAGRQAVALTWRLAQGLAEIHRFCGDRWNQNPTLEWIRNCDLAVAVGGVEFETHGGTLREDARFVKRMLPLLAAQKIEVPSVFVGAQLGPFNTRFGAALFRRMAAKAAAVFPRDRVSASAIHGRMTQPSRSILMPDSALSLELAPAGAGDVFEKRGLAASAATLALVISSALRPDEGSRAHVALFTEVARRLVESAVVAQAIIVVQCDEDRAISLELLRSLHLDHRFLIDDDLSPGQLSSLYGACRIVISSRLHAVILAMLGGVPAVSLAPEVTFKEQAVLELLGLESLYVPTKMGADHAARICLDIAADLEQHRHAVAAAVAAARMQLRTVPDHLREIVQTHRGSG